ncbi:MAG: hypothetical protein Q9178_007913 [Gyalolechia marmorata]
MLPRMAVASENQFPLSTFVPALAAGVRTQVHEAGPHARTVAGNQEVLKNAHVHFLRYNQLSDRAIMASLNRSDVYSSEFARLSQLLKSKARQWQGTICGDFRSFLSNCEVEIRKLNALPAPHTLADLQLVVNIMSIRQEQHTVWLESVKRQARTAKDEYQSLSHHDRQGRKGLQLQGFWRILGDDVQAIEALGNFVPAGVSGNQPVPKAQPYYKDLDSLNWIRFWHDRLSDDVAFSVWYFMINTIPILLNLNDATAGPLMYNSFSIAAHSTYLNVMAPTLEKARFTREAGGYDRTAIVNGEFNFWEPNRDEVYSAFKNAHSVPEAHLQNHPGIECIQMPQHTSASQRSKRGRL